MLNKPSKKTPTKPVLSAHHGAWHAVSVVPGRYGCDAARAQLGRRYLAVEAPRLPLKGCSGQDECSCTYRHHQDRRGPLRRKEDISGLRRRDPGGTDRRVGHCRRLND